MTWSSNSAKPLGTWKRLIWRSSSRTPAQEAGVAISGTGDGDYFLRNCAAYDVVARMKYGGVSVKKASNDVVEHLKEQEGIGGLIAVDLEGNCKPQQQAFPHAGQLLDLM